MGVIIRPQLEGTRFDELPVRGQRAVLRDTMVDMAEHWSNKFLEKHFNSGAPEKYGYQQRKPKYLRRKRRLGEAGIVEMGGRVDLVFTKELMRRVMGSRHNIRGFPSRAAVYLQGPAYFRTVPRDAKRPNLAKEVGTVAPKERDTLVERARKKFTRRLRAEIKTNPRRRAKAKR